MLALNLTANGGASALTRIMISEHQVAWRRIFVMPVFNNLALVQC